MLTILNVAYPFARSGPMRSAARTDASLLDSALVAKGHRSIVVATEGSQIAGLHWPVSAEEGPLDDCARQRAWRRHRLAIDAARRAFRSISSTFTGLISTPIVRWRVDPGYAASSAGLVLARGAGLQPRRYRSAWGLRQSNASGAGRCALSAADRERRRHKNAGGATRQTRFCVVPWAHLPRKGRAPRHRCGEKRDVPLIIAGQVFRYAAHERYFADEIAPHLRPSCRFVGPLRARSQAPLPFGGALPGRSEPGGGNQLPRGHGGAGLWHAGRRVPQWRAPRNYCGRSNRLSGRYPR